MKILSQTKPVSFYLAGGWFNPEQAQCVQDIKNVAETLGVSYFSPKDEVEVNPNSTPEEKKAAFDADVQFIDKCDFVIASTSGKDMGTLFECGHAYTINKPIIYYFKAPRNVPFNLMLAQSAYAVAHDPEELMEILVQEIRHGWTFEHPQVAESNIE